MYNVKFNFGQTTNKLINVTVVNPTADYMMFKRIENDDNTVSYQPSIWMKKVFEAWEANNRPTYLDLSNMENNRWSEDVANTTIISNGDYIKIASVHLSRYVGKLHLSNFKYTYGILRDDEVEFCGLDKDGDYGTWGASLDLYDKLEASHEVDVKDYNYRVHLLNQ